MKTGLVLLALIALASALGSAIMPEVFFRTLLFKSMLFLITLNMLLCTLNRLIRFKWSSFKNTPNPLSNIRQMGILLLHIGIILVIVGAGVYLVLGQSVMLKLAEGETADTSKLFYVSKPFSIHLEKFKIEFNEDGSPSQYYSQVQISEGNETAEGNKMKANAAISVNHPLNYAGIKAYQQSYGNKVRIKVTDPTQKYTESSLSEGESIFIPGTEMTVKMYRYIPNFDPAYGMTFLYVTFNLNQLI